MDHVLLPAVNIKTIGRNDFVSLPQIYTYIYKAFGWRQILAMEVSVYFAIYNLV